MYSRVGARSRESGYHATERKENRKRITERTTLQSEKRTLLSDASHAAVAVTTQYTCCALRIRISRPASTNLFPQQLFSSSPEEFHEEATYHHIHSSGVEQCTCCSQTKCYMNATPQFFLCSLSAVGLSKQLKSLFADLDNSLQRIPEMFAPSGIEAW